MACGTLSMSNDYLEHQENMINSLGHVALLRSCLIGKTEVVNDLIIQRVTQISSRQSSVVNVFLQSLRCIRSYICTCTNLYKTKQGRTKI